MQTVRIDPFLDSDGRVTQLPSKQKKKRAVLEYVAEKFELGNMYDEKQVNAICDRWHTFGDFVLIRRELIDNGLLARERDGSRYWRVWSNVDGNAECADAAHDKQLRE